MQAVAIVAVSVWLAALTVYDLRERRLPNRLTLPGGVAIIAVAATLGYGVPAVAGALALGAVYLSVHLAAPAAMGAGDVKLALGLGALTGAFGAVPWMLAAVGAPLLTVLWALASRSRVLPHGPAMCVASAVAIGWAVGWTWC